MCNAQPVWVTPLLALWVIYLGIQLLCAKAHPFFGRASACQIEVYAMAFNVDVGSGTSTCSN